jgi:hypothetical protein
MAIEPIKPQKLVGITSDLALDLHKLRRSCQGQSLANSLGDETRQEE